MKELLLDVLADERVLRLVTSIRAPFAVVLHAHRFADDELGSRGHAPVLLRRNLELLRRHGFELVSLADLVRRLQEGIPLTHPAVAFTVDDGYADFPRVAEPVFAAYDCPVTVFVTTGFVDGGLWMWWDQVEYAVSRSRRSTITLDLPPFTVHARWSSDEERQAATESICEALKRVPQAVKQEALAAIASALEVEVPDRPPPQYQPMSWDDIRACEGRGISFAPHSVTHPILTQVDDAAARYEIELSWARLQCMVRSPVPIFCYPNGTPGSFAERERACLRTLGMRAAVTTMPGYISPGNGDPGAAQELYDLPRFGYPEGASPDAVRTFRHIIGGIEGGKAWWRRRLSRLFAIPGVFASRALAVHDGGRALGIRPG